MHAGGLCLHLIHLGFLLSILLGGRAVEGAPPNLKDGQEGTHAKPSPGHTVNTGVKPEHFKSYYERALKKKLDFPEKNLEKAAKLQFVFILGFMNETLSNYFMENIKELKALGVPARSIHIIPNPSDKTNAQNLSVLNSMMETLSEKGDLVVFAHSRGAVLALEWALRNPERVKKQVNSMFLVQGAFGGSGVADFYHDKGKPLSSQLPFWAPRTLSSMKAAELRVGHTRNYHGMAELETATSQSRIEKLLGQHAGAVKEVSPKIYYVLGSKSPKEQSITLKPTGWYLETSYGGGQKSPDDRNDGMLVVRDQYVPQVGTVLLRAKADHYSFTIGKNDDPEADKEEREENQMEYDHTAKKPGLALRNPKTALMDAIVRVIE